MMILLLLLLSVQNSNNYNYKERESKRKNKITRCDRTEYILHYFAFMGCVDYKAMQCMCVFECLHICSYACMYVHVNTNKNNKNKQINKSDIGILMVLQVVVFYTFMGIFPFFEWWCVCICVLRLSTPSLSTSLKVRVCDSWSVFSWCEMCHQVTMFFLYFLCSFLFFLFLEVCHMSTGIW